MAQRPTIQMTDLVATDAEFGLLGPLLVRRRGMVVPVPTGKQRVLLAALLLRPEQRVCVDELSDALWGSTPPPSMRESLHNCVKRLRTTLDDGAAPRIVTEPGGYLIRVSAEELDVCRFETALTAGRRAARAGSWAQAAAVLHAGLVLWRGEPLAGVLSDALASRDVPRLAELRLQAVEARIEADLHLGRHSDVIVELRQLVAAEPLRERLHALLMTALFQDGQTAGALAAYRAARATLIRELGAEPGAELRRLHQQILTSQPATVAEAPARPAGAPAGPPALIRPDGLDDITWAAINAPSVRIAGATATRDLPLLITSAAELTEAVAKVVLTTQGVTVPSTATLSDVLDDAHAALDRQPGTGLSADGGVGAIAVGARAIAAQLPELRARYGSGTGRAVAPEIAEELASVAVDGALLWVRWALRRLDQLLKGRPDVLIRDLQTSAFDRGELGERLVAARLADLDVAAQYQLGFHVARRALADAYVVIDEGVHECTATTDLRRWPSGYRRGLLNGLFLSPGGLIDTTPWGVRQAALLARTSGPALITALTDLAGTLRLADYGSRLADDPARKEVQTALRQAWPRLPVEARPAWGAIENLLLGQDDWVGRAG